MKIFKISVLFAALIILSGCSMGKATKETAYEKINKRYISIADYTAEGSATIYGNKTKNQYEFTQYYKQGGKYLLQYKNDIGIVFDTNSIAIKNDQLGSRLKFDSNSKEYFYFFINSFFEKYFTDENVKIKTDSAINEEYIVLECETDGKHFKKQKLWIEIKSVLPYKMQIFDSDDVLAAELEFKSFKFDKNIDDSLFLME